MVPKLIILSGKMEGLHRNSFRASWVFPDLSKHSGHLQYFWGSQASRRCSRSARVRWHRSGKVDAAHANADASDAATDRAHRLHVDLRGVLDIVMADCTGSDSVAA